MAEEKKSESKQLKEKLFASKKHGALRMNEEEQTACEALCKDYMAFLNQSKTEREACANAEALLKEHGFVPFTPGMALKAGDKVYQNNRGKAMIAAIIGSEPITEGVRLCAAHIDSPRLDMKKNPLYEDSELGLFKTHYYGGIKKYQWTAIPLSLHGVIIKADGSKVTVNIGETEGDPVFCVTDLLPHLATEQMKRPSVGLIRGEELNVLVGSMPFKKSEESEAVKLNLLHILYEKYGITEADFVSAELEAVPAFPVKEIGFDRSMIMGYGHDDRVCAYPSFAAMLEIEKPQHTSVCLLVDKEEIGSVGASGMQSHFFEDSVAEIINLLGEYSELKVRRALHNSRVLSSDVSAAFDPNYPSVMEKRNCAYFGKGLVLNKYTGARGKSGSNDANAEYIARLRRIFDDNDVSFQTSELGKVDQGGGGTIAYILANYGMNVIDSGVAVLNMHAPWEIISKVDLYEALHGYVAFLKEA